jgi:hypothetical protein
MESEDKKNRVTPFPGASTDDLRGRQSVRATFKLSLEAIQSLSIVAAHLGIKQKSLFDHLIEDLESLKTLARELGSHDLERDHLVQKTFVLSRRTVLSLDETSRNFNTPRDALVEFSIKRLLPIIHQERENHQKRKNMLKEITAYLNWGKKILNGVKAELGEEDPMYERLEKAIDGVENAREFAQSFVERGKSIEEFVLFSEDEA